MKGLEVIVVGAGIGGLQAALSLAADGHNVTVLESAKSFEEVSSNVGHVQDGFRSNATSGLARAYVKVRKETSLGNRFVDWKGNMLLDCPFHDAERKYGAPYYFIHRADLVNLLVSTALANERIVIRTGCRVAQYDFDAPFVTTVDGEVLKADLVVCADGIESAMRDIINGRPLPPQDTGDVAYRLLVPAKPLLEDPAMAYLVQNPWAVHWMGPEGHAVGYPLREGELYNIIIDVTHSSDRGEPLPDEGQVWKSARSNTELIERFKDWSPEVRKLCAMTGEYLKWRLADFEQLDHWVHSSGKMCLLGDACHPMMPYVEQGKRYNIVKCVLQNVWKGDLVRYEACLLFSLTCNKESIQQKRRLRTLRNLSLFIPIPYLAQGAAQATEDAATLAAALKLYSSTAEALEAYEKQRKPRAAYIARNTMVLQEWLHLYDGPARHHKDERMKQDNADNPIFWGCAERADWLFGHDARELEETNVTPGLTPLHPDEARVYKEFDEMRSRL